MKKIYLLLFVLLIFTQVSFGQISNGDLESWTAGVPDNWTTIDGGITVTEETTTKHSGSASASVEVTTGTQGSTDFRQSISVTTGVEYTFSVWVYHTEGNLKARMFVAGYRGYSDNAITNSWQEITYTFTPTSSPIEIGLRFYDQSGFDGSEIVYVDDYTLTGGSSAAPLATTEAASSITETSATLNGSVSDNGENTTVTFEWGTTSGSYSTSVDAVPATITAGSGATTVSKDLSGLSDGTTYYYRVVATNSEGTTNGLEESFTASTTTLPNLLFSEYVEGSSNNKAIEIINLSGNSVDFSGGDYTVKIYSNGSSTSTTTIDLTGLGTIVDGDVGVITHPSAEATLLALGDATGNVYFNGDDAVALEYLGEKLDIIGQIGTDPGSVWGTEPTTTAEHTLRRKVGTTIGDRNGADAFDPATEWDTYAQNTYSGLGDAAPLPVELTSFSAVKVDGGVMLNWTTATEVNNYGFEVEAELNGSFENVGFVDGHGNSNSPKNYSYFVNSAATSFRLKQVDTDGSFEYSDVVTVSKSLAKTELYQNHPNPFNPSTQISFVIANAGLVNISVYNTLGQKVSELVNSNMNAGTHNVEFNANNFASGFYFYRLETSNFTQTMKMLLIK